MARPIRDNLPTTAPVTRLRATGAITLGMTSAVVHFGEGDEVFARRVGVTHRLFPGGGSWSFFVCPSCSRRARVLRLHDGRVVCWRCDGLIYACQANRNAQTRTDVIERLRARLERAKFGHPAIERQLRRAIVGERRKRLGLRVYD